jgi:serine/threonine-protein kinase
VIGTTIGNYVVKDKIGEGGMGVVYVAEHPRIGRKVAIKVLLPEYSRNAEVVSRFFTEARASSAIKNEHIIDIIDFGELPDGSSYIIMEWLEGTPLTQLLEREGKLALNRALHIARGIGRALAAAHNRGIVHRDLKPDNVFLVQRGDDPEFVKVLDFGIAKLLGSDGVDEQKGVSKTRTGAIIGTPMYMSPEQCRGVAVDERADVYALGVIVYQMLCGRVPFQSEGLGELLLKHMTETPPAPRALDPTISESVERAVMHALEKDPDQRCRRVEDLIAELGGQATARMPARVDTASSSAPATAVHAVKSATDTIGAASGQQVSSPPRRRSNPLWLAAPMLVLGGLALVALSRPHPTATRSSTPSAAGIAAPVPAPVEAAAPTPTPQAPPPPARVRLEVRAIPAEAHLLIDGQPHDNFYAEDLPRDEGRHQIEISAPGYVTYREEVVLDQPRKVVATLLADKKGGRRHSASGSSTTTTSAPQGTPGPKADAPAASNDKGAPIYKGTKAKIITDYAPPE